MLANLPDENLELQRTRSYTARKSCNDAATSSTAGGLCNSISRHIQELFAEASFRDVRIRARPNAMRHVLSG